MIFTSYFAKVKSINKKNNNPKMFINIARFKPKGFEDDNMSHIQELAPSESLLKVYKENLISEDIYEEFYREEVLKTLDDNGYGERLISTLNILSKNRDIYLLCYEASGKFCHRHLLAKILNEKYNLDIKEWIYNE